MRVRGNTIVPPSLFGRFAILCAILRQLHLIVQISVLSSELRALAPSVFFVDQLSAGIPLLRLVCPKALILFYCHFPDKLLAKKGGWFKTLYRAPFDWLESWSTGCSDSIVVNSDFTKGVFGEAFPALRGRSPKVVYPCVDTTAAATAPEPPAGGLWGGKKVFLSINRFERKKGVELAIRAYAGLTAAEREDTRLVIAGEPPALPLPTASQPASALTHTPPRTGGYDPRVPENVSYHAALCTLASSLSLAHATARAAPTALAIPPSVAVLFLLSVPGSFKATLLAAARLLVYTPRHEHFGIVPLEAMMVGVPVLAADEGGPTETVVEGVTGWLRGVGRVEEWTAVMRGVLADGAEEACSRREMGRRGRERVVKEFSKEKMARRLEAEMAKMAEMVARDRVPVLGAGQVVLVVGVLGAVVGLCAMLWRLG